MDNNLILKEYIRTRNRVKETTRKQYEDAIRIFGEFIDKPYINATQIDALDMLDRLKSKKGDSASAKTKNKYLIILNKFYGYLERTKKIDINPFSEIEPYFDNDDYNSEENIIDESKYLNDDEINRFVNVFKKLEATSKNSTDLFLVKRDLALYMLMMHRGFRIGEMTALKFNQIDMVNKIIFVKDGKSKCSNRQVGLNAKIFNLLLEYFEVRKEFDTNDSEFIFISNKGNQISTKTSNMNLKKYMKLAMIDESKAHCHVLRHTCGTTYGSVNPLSEVSALLGHKNLTTSKIYKHETLNSIRHRSNNDSIDSLI